MTAKITADAAGTKVLIGNAAENALEIDSAAKTINPLTPYLFGGGQSLAADGYIKLPGGLIIQWGLSTNTNNTGGGYMTQPFPIPFPNACLTVNCQTITAQPTFPARGCSLADITLNAASFSWINYDAANAVSTAGDSVRYIAIGY